MDKAEPAKEKRYVLSSRHGDGSGTPIVHSKILSEKDMRYWLNAIEDGQGMVWESHEVTDA